MIFCAAGDPGGSRAILPVILELERRNACCSILEHGFLGREIPDALRKGLCPPAEALSAIEQSKVFLYGSSAADIFPLSLARQAKNKGIPVVHVLDNWSTYAGRLATDGLEPLSPDLYAVPDGEARRGALEEGVPSSCLHVTGHPALAAPALNLREFRTKNRRLKAEKRFHLAFINEPFRAVAGEDIHAPGHPGFFEDQVLPELAKSLQPHAANVFLSVLPHPKQSREEVHALWHTIRGRLQGEVSQPDQGQEFLKLVDGVAGMASILLYQAWLAGIPVLSILPECKLNSMRRFHRLEGMAHADEWQKIPDAVEKWIERCVLGDMPETRHELFFHAKAAADLATRILKLGRLER